MQLPRWGSNFMDDKKILDKKLCNNSTHTRKPENVPLARLRLLGC
jgi:hypothetical protein